ncbi:MAG: hypothetical protein MUP47_02890 [Phycisphaerae bacterium]|nr:hypothetical protein [Phycisphaerae bacterium]
MNEAGKTFRDRLLEQEQTSPALKERYRKEIDAMFEQKLSLPLKLAWIGSGILGLGFLAVFGTVAVMAPAEFPLLGRLLFVVGAAFGLAWAILSGAIVRRGSYHRILHSRAGAGLPWGAVVVITTGVLLLSSQHPDRVVSVQMICGSLVFLVMASVFMIQSRIEQSEVRTRQKLLEVELRLAELIGQLRGKA